MPQKNSGDARVRTSMSTNKTIGPDHPLHGCAQAWFLFIVQGPVRARILQVEARNPWAVSFLELISRSGNVSPTCSLLSVSLQRPAMQSELVTEVRLSDFIVDMLDYNVIAHDSTALFMLQNCLSAGDRINIERRLDMMERMREAEDLVDEEFVVTEAIEDEESETDLAAAAADAEKITAAMLDLGFGKNQVRRFVSGLEGRLGKEPLESLIREGLRELGS